MSSAIDERQMAAFGAKMYLRQLDAQRDQLEMQRTQLLRDFPEAGIDQDGEPSAMQFPRVLRLPQSTAPPATTDTELKNELVERARAFKAATKVDVGGTRRVFSDTFKTQSLARLGKEYASDICRDIDVRESVFRGWARKAGVKIPPMPREEVQRRMHQAKRHGKATPNPNPDIEVSDAKSETIKAMLRYGDDGKIHYKELVQHLNLEPVSVHYRLGKCFDVGLVRKKGGGVWEVTPKGRQVAEAT